MLKNKIIVKKIRNIIILLMVLIIMLGAYSNIRRSKAEKVIEILLEVIDKDEILESQIISIEAKEDEDGEYIFDLPKIVNNFIIDKYYLDAENKIVENEIAKGSNMENVTNEIAENANTENATDEIVESEVTENSNAKNATSEFTEIDMNNAEISKTIKLTSEEITSKSVQLTISYDKKEATKLDGTETTVLYNKELKSLGDEDGNGEGDVIVAGYMPADAKLEIKDIDLAELTSVKLENENQTLQKAYEVSVFQEIEVQKEENLIAPQALQAEDNEEQNVATQAVTDESEQTDENTANASAEVNTTANASAEVNTTANASAEVNTTTNTTAETTKNAENQEIASTTTVNASTENQETTGTNTETKKTETSTSAESQETASTIAETQEIEKVEYNPSEYGEKLTIKTKNTQENTVGTIYNLPENIEATNNANSGESTQLTEEMTQQTEVENIEEQEYVSFTTEKTEETIKYTLATEPITLDDNLNETIDSSNQVSNVGSDGSASTNDSSSDESEIMTVADDTTKPVWYGQNLTIDKTNKKVTIELIVTDDNFSSCSLTASDLTVRIGGVNAKSDITKTLSSATTVKGTVNGSTKTIGKKYTLTISNIQQSEIDSGDNYLDYSGVIKITIPAGMATDTSENTNAATTITAGINGTTIERYGLIRNYDAKKNTGTGFSSSATTWTDLCGRKNATLNGGTWNSNGYLTLDGTDDWVNAGTISLTSAATFEATIIPVTVGSNTKIIGNWQCGGAGLYISTDSKFSAQYYIGGELITCASDVTPVAGTRYRLATTFDGSSIKLYINGALKNTVEVSGTIDATENNTVLAIGCNPDGSEAAGQYSNIKVYTARVYNKALTQEQIKSNIAVEKGNTGSEQIVDVVDPAWTVENIKIDSTNKKVTADIIGTDKYLDVDNSVGLTSNNITVKVDGETASSITKTLSEGTALTEERDGVATQYGIKYTLTLTNFEQATFQSSKSYMEWSGAVSITIPKDKLVDQSSNKNTATTLSLGNVDFIKPKIKYTYSESDINKTNKTVKVVFTVTDKYYSSSTLTVDDLTILVDGEDPGSKITKKLTSSNVTATINETSKTIGKKYTLTISNLEQTSIASGDNYLDYSGIITVAIPEGKIKDTSNNSNIAQTITIGVDKTGETEGEIVKTGLIRYYEATNNAGNGFNGETTTWKDLSGNADATLNGGTWNSDGYLTLDGTDDYVDAGEIKLINRATFEATVTPITVKPSTYIVGNWNKGGGGIFINSESKIGIEIYIDGSYVRCMSTVIPEAGKTYKISGTYDGSNLKIYINGELNNTVAASGTIGNPKNGTITAIGANPNGSAAEWGFLNAKVHTIRIYNRALTQTQIKNNINASKQTRYPTYIPEGYTHSGGTMETGYIISDGSGNQFVWIDVPQTAEVYPTAGLNITSFTNAQLTKIENDLHTYTSAYREDGYTDTWTTEEATGMTETEYNTLKKKMLKSIYKYGGFYVGRYEAGTKSARVSEETQSTTAVVKPNMYPYNFVSYTQAQELSESFGTTGYIGSLMYGVQWDLILKHLENNGVTQAELKKDSKEWGNYKNNLYTITNTKSKYSTDGTTWISGAYGEKTSATGVYLSTGASKTFSKMGIYDLAGNVWEKILEKSASYDENKQGVVRGGRATDTGSGATSKSRGEGIVYETLKANSRFPSSTL